MSFDIETTPAVAQMQTQKWWTMQYWKAIAENGTTANGDPVDSFCLDFDQRLPSTIGPAEKVTGRLAFDVPSGTGTLIFVPPASNTGGWEWTYPQ
ncbi:DUF4352 domain-containing protein [Paenarthrobacter nitroguajacolicus]|uniref:DUF4352 domain-containing protein n=1 Tax=Paenarthrobacter nitroguajacolicus TaxID=211146 RepID=UPI001112C6CC|nr:DUF4352 domain-containing protein [Paenarthrobacter nitroguajacolicus]